MSDTPLPEPAPAERGRSAVESREGGLLPLPGWLRNPLLRKGLVLGLLGLLFLLPISLLTELVQERAGRQWQVDQEIGQLWGPPQTVAGPILIVPVIESSGGRGLLLILPEELTVEGVLNPEKRHRGLFETLVYDAALQVSARFRPPTAESLGLQARQVLWGEARLLVAATDLAGVGGSVPVTLAGGGETRLRPATLLQQAGALEAPLAGVLPGSSSELSFTLTLNGSQGFAVAPVGETTQLTLTSSWPHPSFGGAGLPQESSIGPEGFSATWTASAFAEGLPPVTHLTPYELSQGNALWALNSSALAVQLMEPVDAYVMSERAVKYAFFVLALVFAAVFLFEALGRARLHPVQYLLVGAAETLFYLLLLSLTEAIGFDPAYALASLATVGLIALYLGWSLGSRKRGLVLGGGLLAVKLYLYVTLASEDFALLSGSLALFVLLAAVMLGTRKVQWYREARV